MKRLIYLYMLLVAMCISCDNEDNLLVVTPEATGTLTDADGNEYTWARYNGLDWMTSNFREGTPYYELEDPESYWGELLVTVNDMEQAVADYKQFGNLYSYEDALARAPEGWRLPTDEDWQKLEAAMGMPAGTAKKLGMRGTREGELLQDSTENRMALTLSGCVKIRAGRPMYNYLMEAHEYGYYWTATEVPDAYPQGTAVYYRKIAYNSTQIERQISSTYDMDYLNNVYDKFMSVRYVRDALND